MSPFHAARPTEGITERNSVFTDVPISRGAPRGRNNGQERFFTGSPISRGAPREKAVRAGHAAGRVKRAPILRRAPRREQPCPRRAAAGAPPEQPPPHDPAPAGAAQAQKIRLPLLSGGGGSDIRPKEGPPQGRRQRQARRPFYQPRFPCRMSFPKMSAMRLL